MLSPWKVYRLIGGKKRRGELEGDQLKSCSRRVVTGLVLSLNCCPHLLPLSILYGDCFQDKAIMVTSKTVRWSVWRILGIRVLIWAPQRKALFVGIGGDGSEGCSVLLVDKVAPIYMETAVNRAIQLREGLPREIRLYIFRRHPCHLVKQLSPLSMNENEQSTIICFQGTKEKKKTDPGENRDNSGIRRDYFF